MNFYVIKESEHVYGGFGLEYEFVTLVKAECAGDFKDEWHKLYEDYELTGENKYDLGNRTIELISIEEVYECEFNILDKHLPLHQISLS